MVGIVISLIAALPSAPAAASGGGSTCDPGPASCEVWAAADAQPTDMGAEADDEPRYATQAEIDCPAPSMAVILQAIAAGECDGTPRDASYRASRDPESERAPGSLRPGRRDRSLAGGLAAACDGNPSEGQDATSNPAPTQPLALFALPGLPDSGSFSFLVDVAATPRSRQPRPLDRPPRA
jgi:hypothetical protein